MALGDHFWLALHVAREARCADLLIIGADSGKPLDAPRRVNTGDFIMQVGRAILIVANRPEGHETRNCRFMPLLKKAKHLHVVEAAFEEDMPQARVVSADGRANSRDATVTPAHPAFAQSAISKQQIDGGLHRGSFCPDIERS